MDLESPLLTCLFSKVGGFLPVYITSLAFVVLGIAYILVIPESVVKRSTGEEDESKDDEKRSRVNPFVRLWRFLFRFGFDQKIESGTRVVVQVHKKHQQASPRKLQIRLQVAMLHFQTCLTLTKVCPQLFLRDYLGIFPKRRTTPTPPFWERFVQN